MAKTIVFTDEEANLIESILGVIDDHMNDEHPAVWIVCGKMVDAETAGINIRFLNFSEDGMLYTKEDSSYAAFQKAIRKFTK